MPTGGNSNLLKLPVMFCFKVRERERERERIPATSPSELLGESNKNVCRSTFKAIKHYPVVLSLLWGHNALDESDKSFGVFSKT